MRKNSKWLVILLSLLTILCFTACGSSAPAQESASAPAQEEASTAAEEEPSTALEEAIAGVPNPWQTADTLEEAAKGGGLDFFEYDPVTLSLGEVKPEEYRYSPGIVDIYAPVAAVDLTIRKGLKSALVEKDDISGDYGEYKYSWTQNIKGLEVKCFGNRKGEATKTIWNVGDSYFAILARGAGGDDDFGLSADDLSSLINSIQ